MTLTPGKLAIMLLVAGRTACPGETRDEGARLEDRAPEETTMLSCELKVDERQVLGKAIPVRFTLRNSSSRTLYVLSWYTPLEGMLGDIFRVTVNDKEIQYVGRMVKRGDPAANEYVELDPGSSISATVDLTEGYEIVAPGAYQLELRSGPSDVAYDVKAVPRPRDKHRAVELDCPPVRFTIDGH
jgi:peptidyl-Lys metalloendopeptidase